MESNPSESICVYGAGVLVRHIDALAKEVEGVRSGSEDIEYIHKARVASRRLRSALPLFQSCLPRKKQKSWLKEIKAVTRALGAARDADVQIDRLAKLAADLPDKRCKPGLDRLMLRLRQTRASLQPGVDEAMQLLLHDLTLDEMRAHLQPLAERQSRVYLYTPALYQHAFGAISTCLDDFLSYESIIDQPEKIAELHAMRISAKWLRYSMENLAALYSNGLKDELQVIRKVQETLGSIHDHDVWIEFLPRFLQEERERTLSYYGNLRMFHRLVAGIEYFLQDCTETRARYYREFLGDWQRWKDKAIWQNLREQIQSPFFKLIPFAEAEDAENKPAQ